MIENYGWDLVYACSTDYINQQLAANPSACIQNFNVSMPSLISGHSYTASGSFGPWQMVNGGYGEMLQFKVPVIQGTLGAHGAASPSISIDGIVLLVEAQLTVSAGPTFKLTFDTSSQSVKAPSISLIDIATTGTALASKGHPYTAIAQELLSQSLLANVHQLSFEFASFTAPTSGVNADLLAATQVSYAYGDTPSGAGGLALLASVTPNPTLAQMFDPSLLGTGNFGCLVSTQSVLNHCFIPALLTAFGGSTSGSFVLNSPTAITLKTPLSLKPVKTPHNYVHPKLTALSLSVNGFNSYMLSVCTKTLFAPGVVVVLSARTSDGINFSSAKQCIGTATGSTVNFTHQTQKALVAQVLSITMAIQGALESVMEAELNAIIDTLESSMQHLLGTECTSPITWCGQKSLSLTAGGANGNFFLQGDLT